MTFSDFDLGPDLHRALEEIGFTEPTPIQQQVIGPALAGHDIIGVA